VPELPPIDPYVDALRELFDWLEGRPVVPVGAPQSSLGADLEVAWAPPSMITAWGTVAPLEAIRFAAANRLCVDLGYHGTVRRVEPYSLRRTRDGHLLLYAVRRDPRADRSYRVDRIESVRISKESFTPAYPVEFWPTGAISAPALVRRLSFTSPQPRMSRQRRSSSRRWASGPRYVVECLTCRKRFVRRDANLRKHKMRGRRAECPGRIGRIVRPAR
jgi:hypothetical protein